MIASGRYTQIQILESQECMIPKAVEDINEQKNIKIGIGQLCLMENYDLGKLTKNKGNNRVTLMTTYKRFAEDSIQLP